MHGEGKATIKSSVLFLTRYEEELQSVASDRDLDKGMDVGSRAVAYTCARSPQVMQWSRPPPGVVS